ncbi:hypothetical protein [Bradyrhizobium sp. LTSPM299]|uniref:hypothetical protein n=1 Tax=Bradyrhizobium sp. LTSPM299 TaxID=1619233 RepID=UPI0012E14080|nr:hypothetical protein [Bradyrhizobium sp. LTSPM299]
MFVDQLLGEFEDRLPHGLAGPITAANWCGSNSIFRRAKAANDLKNQLEILAGEGPILIIGHSHGGNVVMQATSKLRDLSNIYVCTLATPFFRLFESDRRFNGARALLRMSSLAACILASIFSVDELTVNDNPISLLIILAAFVIGWIGGGLLFKLLINPVPKNKIPTRWQLRSRMLCESTVADARLLKDHLLVLRAIDDEAALSLAAGAVANRLLRVAYALALKVLQASVITPPESRWRWFFFFIPALFFAPLLLFGISCVALFGPYTTAVGIALVFITPVLAIFLVPLTRTVFGRELAVGSIGCDAFFDSVPDSGLATVITLGLRRDETLSHALYDHPLAAPTIANWIASHVVEGDQKSFDCSRSAAP